MDFKLITPPAEMPVSIDEARTAARANGTDNDQEIQSRVNALTEEAEHIIGQAIINRTYRATLASFPDTIVLPAAPVASVNEITYFDADGAEQTLPIDSYFLNAKGVIERTPGTSWPVTQERSNAVKVDVVVGHGADSSSAPAAFKGYILAKTREYFAPAGTPESPHLIRQLDSLKVYR